MDSSRGCSRHRSADWTPERGIHRASGKPYISDQTRPKTWYYNDCHSGGPCSLFDFAWRDTHVEINSLPETTQQSKQTSHSAIGWIKSPITFLQIKTHPRSCATKQTLFKRRPRTAADDSNIREVGDTTTSDTRSNAIDAQEEDSGLRIVEDLEDNGRRVVILPPAYAAA